MFYKLFTVFLLNFIVIFSKDTMVFKSETLTKNQLIEISAVLAKEYRINEIKDNYFKLVIFDTMFNIDYFNGSSILQRSLNRYYGTTIKVDGVMGNETISLLNKVKDSERFIQIFLNERLRYYKSLKK